MARKDRKLKEIRPSMPVVIGAGITEQWYFTHLKALKKLQIQIRPRFFGNEHIQALTKRVEHVLSTEGRAVVVFDKDVQAWDSGEKARYEAFIKRYGKDRRVAICDSMPSIEYWFLLHYLNTNRYYGTSKAVVEELLRFIPKFEKTDRFLHARKWVEELCADGKLELATERALAFGDEGESYTNIPNLFLT
ncbi:MAG: RloB domain-containing protein [Bacteroidaceae bacterium]|nr:RloB domain-containing protein [Bacteroidaceae bacterium]